MLCDICHKNEATNHIKKIVNDKISQLHLCPECAAKHGYGDIFNSFGLNLNNFFAGMMDFPILGQPLRKDAETVCPSCGQSFSDIVKSGRIGCAECYDVFCDRIMPNIRNIHGDTSHVGKIPISAGQEAHRKAEIESLKASLADAVQAQEFEKAAELRDKIKELEGESNE